MGTRGTGWWDGDGGDRMGRWGQDGMVGMRSWDGEQRDGMVAVGMGW